MVQYKRASQFTCDIPHRWSDTAYVFFPLVLSETLSMSRCSPSEQWHGQQNGSDQTPSAFPSVNTHAIEHRTIQLTMLRYTTSILALEHSCIIIWSITRKSSTFFFVKFLELPSSIFWHNFWKLAEGKLSSFGEVFNMFDYLQVKSGEKEREELYFF